MSILQGQSRACVDRAANNKTRDELLSYICLLRLLTPEVFRHQSHNCLVQDERLGFP